LPTDSIQITVNKKGNSISFILENLDLD